MLTIKNLLEENANQLKRINCPSNENLQIQKALIFESSLAHKDNLIKITDCPLAVKDNRGYHALSVGGIITAGYPNVKLYTMHNEGEWLPIINWCIDNNVRVISMSMATSKTNERERALKKYADWGGIFVAAAGNWEGHNVSYPADSDYTIAVSATNSEDSNGVEVDITVDSYWKAKRYNREGFASFSGTSGATPVVSAIALRYLNANPSGNLESFRTWLLVNSIKNIDHLYYDYAFGNLENGERYFVYPFNLKDRLLPIEIKLQIGNKTMLVNGVGKQLRVAPFLKKYSDEFSATCTEIRPVFEEIGNVEWDKETNTVIIKV